MGPVRMYRTYNLFPWAFLFHLLLVALISFEVIIINVTTHAYSRDTRISFFYFMLNKDIGANDFFYDRNRAFYSIDDMRTQLTTSLNWYNSLPVFAEIHYEGAKSDVLNDSKHNYPNLCPCNTTDPLYPDSNLNCVNNDDKQPLPTPIANLTNSELIGDYFSYPQACINNTTKKIGMY